VLTIVSPTCMCPWTINCLACFVVLASPRLNTSVCNRLESTSPTLSARTSPSVAPLFSIPSLASRSRSCFVSRSDCSPWSAISLFAWLVNPLSLLSNFHSSLFVFCLYAF